MKKEPTFIPMDRSVVFTKPKEQTTTGYKITNYLNSKFPRLMWKIQNKVIAPVKNHRDYIKFRNFVIDFVSTALLLVFVLWSFGFSNPMQKGFGVAVIVALAQYYIEWYFGVRKEPPKRVLIENDSLKVNVQNNSLDVRMRQ